MRGFANLTHGAFLHARHLFCGNCDAAPYEGLDIWVTAIGAGVVVAAIGGLFERLVLTRLKANPLGQVLVTLGMSFIISDACLVLWGGDSIPVPTPQYLQAPTRFFGFVFPTYRLVLVGCAVAAAIVLYFLLERTRLGAMIRAGVDDGQMARAVGIPVSNRPRPCFAWVRESPVPGVCWGARFFQPIRGSMPTCCPWR